MKNTYWYLKEWDEPLNENILSKAKDFIKKMIYHAKGIFTACALGVLAFGGVSNLPAQEVKQAQEVIIDDQEITKADQELLLTWAEKNQDELMARQKDAYKYVYKTQEIMAKIYEAALSYYGNQDQTQEYFKNLLEKIRENFVVTAVEKEMSKINLLKEGKEEEFLNWVVKCADENNIAIMEFLENELAKLRLNNSI